MKYKYKAINQNDQTIEGIIVADSKEKAIEKLNSRRLYIKEIKPIFFDNSIIITDAVLEEFYEEFLILLRTGLTLLEIFYVLSENSKEYKAMLEYVIIELKNGAPLNEAMEEILEKTSPMAKQILEMGEKTGSLEISFEILLDMVRSRRKIKSKIMTSIGYPMFLYYVALVIIAALSILIIPKLAGMVAMMKKKTFATQIFSSFMYLKSHPYIFILFGLIPVFFISAVFIDGLQGLVLTILNFIPVVGTVYRSWLYWQISYVMHICFRSGLTLLNIFGLLKEMIKDEKFNKVFSQAGEILNKGEDIVEYFKKNGFDNIWCRFFKVGEKSGNLEETMRVSAIYYEKRFSKVLETALSLLEPLFLLGIAGVIGLLAIGLVAPMMAMYSKR